MELRNYAEYGLIAKGNESHPHSPSSFGRTYSVADGYTEAGQGTRGFSRVYSCEEEMRRKPRVPVLVN